MHGATAGHKAKLQIHERALHRVNWVRRCISCCTVDRARSGRISAAPENPLDNGQPVRELIGSPRHQIRDMQPVVVVIEAT